MENIVMITIKSLQKKQILTLDNPGGVDVIKQTKPNLIFFSASFFFLLIPFFFLSLSYSLFFFFSLLSLALLQTLVMNVTPALNNL